jgi:hypothetical protein
MSGSSSNSSTRTDVFTVTVSGDPRFISTIRLLTHKAAEADGCPEASAARLADAVERVLTLCLGSELEALAAGAMDLSFEPSAGAFAVEIRVPAPAVAASGTLERTLAARGDLDAVRRLVPDAEFGAVGSHQFCRMACAHAGS